MMRLDPALSDEGPNGEESVTTVDLEKAMRQESRQLELPLEDRGEAPKVEGSGEAGTVAHGDERSGSEHLLMEEVVGRANLVGALKRVRQNKGSPGIDGMSVEELPEYLRRHWGEIRQRLLAGTYQPKPVRRQEIPKSGGGVRELGIPTVLDRAMGSFTAVSVIGTSCRCAESPFAPISRHNGASALLSETANHCSLRRHVVGRFCVWG